MPDIIDEMVDQGLLVLKKEPKQKKHRFHPDGGLAPGDVPRVEAHKHPNGGGWVANTAKVATSVYVAPTSEVFDYAEITGHTIIRGKCRVFGHARIDGDVTILGDVIIKDSARICGRATLAGRIDVKNNVCIYGTSAIRGEVILCGNSVINESIIAGWGSISGRAAVSSSTLEGDFCICDHATINTSTMCGCFLVSDTATICSSRITNTVVPYSRFVRKKLVKIAGVPPSREFKQCDLPHDTNCISTATNQQLRWTNILRGRTTIVASDVHMPLHCLRTVGFNKVTINNGGVSAVVIIRAITVTEGYYSWPQLRDLMTDNAASQRSAGTSNRPNVAPAIPPAAVGAGAIAVFDPRGSRIIRV